MRIGARLVTMRCKVRQYWLMQKNDKRQLSPAKTIYRAAFKTCNPFIIYK